MLAKNTQHSSISSQVVNFKDEYVKELCGKFALKGTWIFYPVHKPGHWYFTAVKNHTVFIADSISPDVDHASMTYKKLW